MDLASLRKLQQKRKALRSTDLFSYTDDLRSVMVSVETCSPDEDVKSVVATMARKGISSIVIVDPEGAPVGILTERDVLQKIVAVEGLDMARTAISEVMTRDPATLSPDVSVYRALFLLSSHGFKHLPLIEDGRVVGIVTLRQLLKLRYPEPLTLAEGIAGARTFDELRDIKVRLPRLAASRLSLGIRAYDVVLMLSLIHHDLHRKAFELAMQQTGEPPASCCLFVTGSQGRMESLFTSDQDHGLVLGTDGEDVEPYYAEVTQVFTDAMERIGFRRCPGDVMASNPTWRKSLDGWKRQLDGWVVRQDPNLGRYATIFFDALPVWGDASLFQELNDHAFTLLGRHQEVLRILHEEAGSHRVPTSFFGKFITESKGEHRGELDIKRSGLIFVVEGVRILALDHGIRETATLKRITKLVDGGHLNSDDGEYYEAAYRFLLHFALDAQIKEALDKEEIDTYINPHLLSPWSRQMLRHAYKAVTSLQERIASEMGELVI